MTMGITGENVTVAIIDANFNPNDPDISPRVSYSAVFAACEDLTCGSMIIWYMHGTLVAHVMFQRIVTACISGRYGT